MTAWNHEIKEFMGSMGINSIEALRGNRLMLRGIGLTDGRSRCWAWPTPVNEPVEKMRRYDTMIIDASSLPIPP